MKPATLSSRRFLFVGLLVLALVLFWGVGSFLGLVPGGGIALAAPSPLEVSVENPLSLLGELVIVSVGGNLANVAQDAHLVVLLKGPAEIFQIRLAAPELREAARMVVALNQVLPGGALSTQGRADKEGASQSVFRLRVSDAQLELPGAYLVVVQIERRGEILAQGQTWIGKVPSRQHPVDLALVLPVYLGCHRDLDDAFYDQVVQEAVGEAANRQGGLAAIASLPQVFPDLRFTVVPEPVLLTQLRDLADGYVEKDPQGNKTDIPAESPIARAAAEVLLALRALAGNPSVEVTVAPYATPDLELLAAQGWRDGYEQLLVAKQELGHTLALSYSPRCGYAPGLFLTGKSLNYFANAALDQVLVSEEVAAFLSGADREGEVFLRARSGDNERVTLVFVNPGLASLMSAPYDVGEFCAGLGSALAKEEVSVVVAAPRAPDSLLPGDFVIALGEAISSVPWLRTKTISELASGRSSSGRPALLGSTPSSSLCSGYIEHTWLARVQEAHSAVLDLATVTEPTRAVVETARKWLYLAESAWWTRPTSSPREATIGLGFAEQSAALARGELAKVKLLDLRSTPVRGREGVVNLLVENSTDYPLKIKVKVHGEGLISKSGEQLEVQLEPGTTVVPIEVRETGGAHQLHVQLVAGQSILGEIIREIRFVTVTSVIPWMVLGALALGGGILWAVQGRRVRRWRRTRRQTSL